MIGRAVAFTPLACLAVAAQPAWAQTAADSAAQPAAPGAGQGAQAPVDSSQRGIAEIVVTAQRRSQTAQKVPVAITAVSGDTIRKLGIRDAAGLQNLVPNLNVATQNGQVLIGIRGIYSITATVANGSPEVAVGVDGVYQSRPAAIAGDFFDINRVEVLRGPQGTLYGRNATGGSVNIITNKPSTDGLSGLASLGVGNYGEISSYGAVNLPLSSTTAVRASFNFLRHDGYLGGYFNDADDTSVRLQLLTKPTDDLSILLSGYHFEQGGHGEADVIVPFVDKNHFANTENYPHDSQQNNRHWGLNAQLDWNLGFATLTYIPAYLQVRVRLTPAYTIGLLYNSDNLSKQYSQELRLASNGNSRARGNLTWVAGLYWLREDQPYTFAIPFIQENLADRIVNNSYAAFGQATYALTDRIRATGGLRYTHDQASQTGTGGALGIQAPVGGSTRSSNVGWRAGIDADVAPNSLVYASVSSGYKAGGLFTGGTASNTYRPETLVSYEIGTKNSFFSRTLQFNAAAFYYDYNDYQASETIFLPGSGIVNATYNAGKARVYGIEMESTWKPFADDQFDFSLTAEKASFITFFLPPMTDFSGNALPNVSRFTAALGYQHSFELTGGSRITGRVYSKYASPYFASFTNNPASRQRAYTNTEANIIYTPQSQKWSVTGYVKNLENTAVKTYLSSGVFNSTASISDPRTYGVRLNVNF